jgi:hypothetical protein
MRLLRIRAPLAPWRSVLLGLGQLPAGGVKFDGESHDLVLESPNLGAVFGLSPELLTQPIDFHGPMRLMSLLSKLSPLSAGIRFGGRGFCGLHPLSHLRDVGGYLGRVGRRGFLSPDLKYPRGLADGAVARAQLAPQRSSA